MGKKEKEIVEWQYHFYLVPHAGCFTFKTKEKIELLPFGVFHI